MKKALTIVFIALLFGVSFLTGCAGTLAQTPQTGINDRVGTVEAAARAGAPEKRTAETVATVADEKGSEAAKTGATAEKPAAKVFVDKKGKFEINSTPFGYMKREIKQGEKAPSAPVSGQTESVTPVAPQVKAPAAQSGFGAGAAGPTPKPPESAGQISFDFDDADLYAVIRTMADMLKINYIIEPGVTGKVTIHTAGRLKGADVFPIFHQTLEVNGLVAVKEGNVFRIGKLKDAMRMPIASRILKDAKDIPPEERIVIQIIPLKFISAQEVTKVITPFISADGTIISEGGSNTLLVVDKGSNIFKVLKLVEVFDVSVFERMRYHFYTLQNINAEEAAKLLKEVLPGGSKDDVRFVPINRLNTLLIVSPTVEVFSRVDAVIRQLDVPSETAQPQIYIYSVKNGMAAELGETVQAIFGKTTEVVKSSSSRESVPSNPFAKGYAATPATQASAAATAAAPAAATAAAATPRTATPAATTTGTGPSVALRGNIRITVDPVRNALIIEAIPADYQIVERILGRLDVLPRQVLIEVVIAEISLSKGTELGVEWSFKKDLGGDSGLLSASVGASGLQYALGLSQQWQVALHALARDSKLNILSSPSVLASDNKPARIDVTTEVPIPSTSYQIQTTGPSVLETKVEYRNTGVILDVTPHINEHGLVTMDVTQEVSNVGELVKVAGQDYYTFNKRRVMTALTVKHNQTIVIGGLISDQKNDAATGVPWLVKIPLLRWLFGAETNSVSKSELIVMITPRVITSLDDVDAVSEEFRKKIGNASAVFR